LWEGAETTASALLVARGGTAAAVTAFVQGDLAPRVVDIEMALTLANQQAQTYCAGYQVGLVLCLEHDVDPADGAAMTLAEVFSQQALRLSGASRVLATRLNSLRLGSPLITIQMANLIEDLTLCSEQLVRLLQEYAQPLLRLGRLPAIASEAGEAVRGLGYEPRVRSAVAILRRAEGWLESIDHESGAHVDLPGFTPGAPSLESQLALQ
jgi:hypothetical protein